MQIKRIQWDYDACKKYCEWQKIDKEFQDEYIYWSQIWAGIHLRELVNRNHMMIKDDIKIDNSLK